MYEESVSSEVVASRFNRLLQELLRGKLKRNCFQRWEVDLLLDIESCEMGPGAKRQALKRYQRAVTRQLERGASTPFKLSEYLHRGRNASDAILKT
jgi:hypothetical protein